jgi:uncharacterized protein (TIGR00369 family)
MTDAAERSGDQGRNDELRKRFRGIYQDEVAFNRLIGLRIREWSIEGVVFEVPFRDDLTSHSSTFHGGVLATLVDAAAGGAVLAGHDFAFGSRMSTVSMSINFISSAPREGLVATASCTRRGRSLHYVHVVVTSSETRKTVAEGVVVCNTSGRSKPEAQMYE